MAKWSTMAQVDPILRLQLSLMKA
ncbi:hypothetical protein CCACVL1_24941 [Corchorus capsularis]|uniref:Uncharacterized protein n=1 Tax=Corchorus capsularis TaxID=210143 RepID=A0A1R3GMK2_COCAP|nr:hypothetical protein CCACVL1_24941 [Corchorus capsularis]